MANHSDHNSMTHAGAGHGDHHPGMEESKAPEHATGQEPQLIHPGHAMNNHSGHEMAEPSGHEMAEHPGPEEKPHHDHHAMMVEDFKNRFLISLLLTVPILILSPMIQMFLGTDLRFNNDTFLLFALSTILFIYGGKPFILGAKDELAQRSPGMMTLIAMAISVAYIYSALTVFILPGMDFFWELATLIVIMLLGHWIEMKSVLGATRALEELVKLMPEEAHLVTAGDETMDVAVNILKAGDIILVKPGERIPIDGEVLRGRSTVNEAMITGESTPIEKEPGAAVIGGAINGEGSFRIRVSRTGPETYLAQIIVLVREAQKTRSNTQRLA
ncbi:MAG: heavy metal translocating P-type ATPase, partial [Syntrophomonadaceae bacterium]